MCVIFCRYNVIIADISKYFKQNVIKLFKNVKSEQHEQALFQNSTGIDECGIMKKRICKRQKGGCPWQNEENPNNKDG